jgi:hypothetical protein
MGSSYAGAECGSMGGDMYGGDGDMYGGDIIGGRSIIADTADDCAVPVTADIAYGGSTYASADVCDPQYEYVYYDQDIPAVGVVAPAVVSAPVTPVISTGSVAVGTSSVTGTSTGSTSLLNRLATSTTTASGSSTSLTDKLAATSQKESCSCNSQSSSLLDLIKKRLGFGNKEQKGKSDCAKCAAKQNLLNLIKAKTTKKCEDPKPKHAKNVPKSPLQNLVNTNKAKKMPKKGGKIVYPAKKTAPLHGAPRNAAIC